MVLILVDHLLSFLSGRIIEDKASKYYYFNRDGTALSSFDVRSSYPIRVVLDTETTRNTFLLFICTKFKYVYWDAICTWII